LLREKTTEKMLRPSPNIFNARPKNCNIYK
jgi:hypothetical protein